MLLEIGRTLNGLLLRDRLGEVNSLTLCFLAVEALIATFEPLRGLFHPLSFVFQFKVVASAPILGEVNVGGSACPGKPMKHDGLPDGVGLLSQSL